jgi:hypothetical protein
MVVHRHLGDQDHPALPEVILNAIEADELKRSRVHEPAPLLSFCCCV